MSGRDVKAVAGVFGTGVAMVLGSVVFAAGLKVIRVAERVGDLIGARR